MDRSCLRGRPAWIMGLSVCGMWMRKGATYEVTTETHAGGYTKVLGSPRLEGDDCLILTCNSAGTVRQGTEEVDSECGIL